MNEEDIFPTVSAFGPLKDVSIIRDKHSGAHRGCAFVTFWNAPDAELCRQSLHDQYTFPGARRPAQVKPAELSVPENKLFIGMLSRKAEEEQVRELFAPFGEIREIYMIRNADGSSKCAAFLRFVEREAAQHAIESLHNNIVMDGSNRPLIVKFADNKVQKQQRHVRNMRRQELIAQMQGVPPQYPGYPPAPHHMGMSGGPPHQYHPHHHHPHHPGMAPQYPPAPGAYGAGSPPQAPPGAYMYPPHAGFVPTPYGAAAGGYGRSSGMPQQLPNAAASSQLPSSGSNPRPREGPAGANLFVYHLPHDLSDADLATAFNPFGTVISAKVYVDKYTGESKGFGK
jgi:CUG-BP- and ETR3-like factor